MTTLIIDTTTERGLIALAQDNTIVLEIELPLGLQNSKYALPTIHDSLAKLNLIPRDLTQIICGIGPGSYTGIRVGAIIAKTLSYSLKIPLIGVSSLLAYPSLPNSAALIDAKIGGAYFSINGSSPNVLPLAALAKLLKEITHFFTPIQEPIKSKLSHLGIMGTWVETAPAASKMLSLSKEKGATIDGTLELLYLLEWSPTSS